MSSRLLQRKTLIETKNRTLKCLKWHYSTVRSGGFDISRAPIPENLPSKAKNMPKSGGQPWGGGGGGGGGGGWAQLELTDAKRE